jgi:hypothetical protein
MEGMHSSEKETQADALRGRYRTLEESVYAWCDPLQHEKGILSFDKIVEIAASDESGREVLRKSLSVGGAAYQRDPEIADGIRERLAWAVITRLDKMLAERRP